MKRNCSHFRGNFRISANIFAKISVQKMTKIAQTLMMWTTWGTEHIIMFTIGGIFEHYFIKI
jgi:hypothetical protein